MSTPITARPAVAAAPRTVKKLTVVVHSGYLLSENEALAVLSGVAKVDRYGELEVPAETPHHITDDELIQAEAEQRMAESIADALNIAPEELEVVHQFIDRNESDVRVSIRIDDEEETREIQVREIKFDAYELAEPDTDADD